MVLVAGAWLLVSGLPSDPMGVESYRSAADSRLEAANGQLMAEFPLVESVEPLRIDSTLLVEAYLALQPGAFYEARVDRTLPVLPVVFGALRGERLLASPLSRAVADALTSSENRGALRDLRIDLLAARLDSTAELHERTAAYLQTLPLCHGHRGIVEALRRCLGATGVDPIGPAEAAFVAAAAAFDLDLSDDIDVLRARAAAVLDRLALQRRLDAERAPAALSEAVQRARVRRSVPRPAGLDPLVVSLTEQTRRRFGMGIEPTPIVISTTLRSETQAGFGALPALADGTWVVVDPRDGTAAALGGDLVAPVTLAPDSLLAAFLPRGERRPTVSDLVGGLLGAVEALGGVPSSEDGPRRLGAVTSLRLGARTEDGPQDGPIIHPFEGAEEDAWLALERLPREGRLRVAREGRVAVFVHPGALGVLLGSDRESVQEMQMPASLVPVTVTTDEFRVPDGLWVATDGTVHRRGATTEQ